MTWKEKLKTLCSKWFVTREEYNNTSEVIFFNNRSDFTIKYNDYEYHTTHMSDSYIVAIEMPYGRYELELYSEHYCTIYESYTGSITINKKITFLDTYYEPQE